MAMFDVAGTNNSVLSAGLSRVAQEAKSTDAATRAQAKSDLDKLIATAGTMGVDTSNLQNLKTDFDALMENPSADSAAVSPDILALAEALHIDDEG